MFQPFFICFALPLLVLADSLFQTTITPDAADLVAGSWTISVPLPSPTTLQVFIETLFGEYNSVTLVGPTTFISLVRDRSAHSTTATAGTEDSNTSNTPSSGAIGGSATTSGAASVSTGDGAASEIPSGRSKAANSTSSPTLAAPPSVGTQNQPHYGMDPDSAMAMEYDKAYANVTYTPPAYVPAKIPADVCVLWDPTCKGNKARAAEEFFGQGKANSSDTMFDLLLDPCFDGQGTDGSGTNCTSSLLNPASASFSSAAKSYMREPQCSEDYQSAYPVSSRTFNKCCGTCFIYGPNVDVYYWPEPNADTSCLSIIGSDVIPLNEGAQTDEAGVVFWAASTNLYDIYVPTVTTAVITTINGIVVKEAIANPWGASPSITTTRPISSVKKRSQLSVHPRAFNPLYGRQLGSNGNSSVGTEITASARASEITGSIAVSDGFTFTSPSIYVAFYSLSATDDCGVRGNNIPSTMLAFAPGELSTVQGHLWGGGVQQQKTKVFDFADLPCPPFNVMYDDWYKPAPGEPYRPLIALPEKVRDLDPLWNACTDAFYFTGLDPPRTLQKAGAMVAPTSPAANPDPTVTPDPVQSVPPLPVQTDAGKAAGDPSNNKNLDPSPQAAPPSTGGASNPSPNDGVLPTSTQKQAAPQQGETSKPPTGSPAVDPGTNNNANPPATPQHGTDPKANDSGNTDPGASGSGSNHPASNGSGSTDPGSNDSGSTNPTSNDPGSTDPGSNHPGSNDSGSNNSGSSNPGPNDSPTANPQSSSTAGQQSGQGQQAADPKKVPSPAQNSDPQADPANANTGTQLGSGNQNPASKPTTNGNPSHSGESHVGTNTIPQGPSENKPFSSETSPVLDVAGALPLTQGSNNHNAYIVASSTLLPGSPGAVISGTSYSLASSGALVVGTSTIPLATAGAVAGQIAAPAALWAGNVPFTPLLGGSAIVGSSTLSLSGPAITSSGSALSLASGGLVVGSSTYAFATSPSNPAASSTTQEVPIITALVVAGQSFTANPSAFSIDGTSISAGKPGITISETPVSLDVNKNLAVETSTVALESTSIRPAATSVVAFEGSGVRSKMACWTLAAAIMASMLGRLL